MAEGTTPTIQIGQLHLRIPGNNAEVGHRVANGMAESLAQQLPSGLQGQFGALNLQVRLPPGASEAEMSGAIAQAIINVLQRGTGLSETNH
jgi:hypothetical protein